MKGKLIYFDDAKWDRMVDLPLHCSPTQATTKKSGLSLRCSISESWNDSSPFRSLTGDDMTGDGPKFPPPSLLPMTLNDSFGSLITEGSIVCDFRGAGDRLRASAARVFSKIVGWFESAADGRFLECDENLGRSRSLNFLSVSNRDILEEDEPAPSFLLNFPRLYSGWDMLLNV